MMETYNNLSWKLDYIEIMDQKHRTDFNRKKIEETKHHS